MLLTGSAALAAGGHPAAPASAHAASKCASNHGLVACLTIAGKGATLGHMTATETWNRRGPMGNVLLSIDGPARFDIQTGGGGMLEPPAPNLPSGVGISLGWIQAKRPAAIGKYCAVATGTKNKTIFVVSACIKVRR